MSNTQLTTLTSKLAAKFDLGDGSGLLDTLKKTAFKGAVSDEQMTALLIVANHIRISEAGCRECQRNYKRDQRAAKQRN